MHKTLLAVVLIALTAVLILMAPIEPAPTLAQLASTATPIGFPTVTPLYTSTPEPTATPLLTPPATSAAPGCGSLLPIEIGTTIAVRGGINIRAMPTINGPLVTQLAENWVFVVVDGPVCSDGYDWWAIADGGEIRGWVAERNSVMPFIIDVDVPEYTCASPLNLVVGEEIELVENVRIRNAPSRSGRVLTVASLGTVATVLDVKTVCAEGYVWRNVRVEVLDYIYDGWMAEGSAVDYSTFYLDAPQPECYPPGNFEVGGQYRIRYSDTNPNNLRAEPGSHGAVLYTLMRGVPVEIIGSSVCMDGMNWWQVRVMASIEAVGWVAEGPRGNYWLEPFVREGVFPGQ